MGRMRRPIFESGVYFITYSTFQQKNFFSYPQFAQIVVDQWKYYEVVYMFTLHAYCVMPDHNHVLFDVGEIKTISEIVHAVNSHIARLVNHHMGKKVKEKVFQGGFWDEVIRAEDMYWQKLSYILFNPYRSRLVRDPLDDYVYSNIQELINMEGEEFVMDLFSRYKRWSE